MQEYWYPKTRFPKFNVCTIFKVRPILTHFVFVALLIPIDVVFFLEMLLLKTRSSNELIFQNMQLNNHFLSNLNFYLKFSH